MNNIKVSISVPVYNTAEYLPQCIDSLLSQTLQEIEIILVDDGSTDSSGKICDDYAKKDNRIRVFHKENGGLASARQVALENCRGEYYIVCDSDDWVEPSMYEEMYNRAKSENADMLICNFYFDYPNGKQIEYKHNFQGFSQNRLIKDVLTQRLLGSAWSKLVRSSIYNQYDLSWELGINQGEDVLILLKLLQCPLKVSHLAKSFYHYRRDITMNSYTNRPTFATFKQIEYINKWATQNLSQVTFERELFIFIINLAFTGLRTKDMPVDYYKAFISKNLPFKHFLRYRFLSIKSVLIITSILNHNIAIVLLKLTYKFFYK